LAQNELHQKAAGDKCGQPIAASGRMRQARWIDRQVRKDDTHRSILPDGDETVHPALADQNLVASRARAECEAEAGGERRHSAARQVEREQAAAALALEKVAGPILDAVDGGAVSGDKRSLRPRR